ncbi:MAG TPA: carboxypeptidase regulatory-like domain-containing protein, partial [Polyangiaceae bacterium]
GGTMPSSGSAGAGSQATGTGGTLMLKEGGAAAAPSSGPCTNLQCQQVVCGDGGPLTSVSGTVFDPAGKVPLYNVVVYVPNAPLEPLPDGASCQTCDGDFSGHPIAVALTDSHGNFKVDDVPVGDNIPLVIQVGKWRRQLTIPHVEQCVDNPLPDADLTRLPRNQSEGDLPKIAISLGGSDSLECLLMRIGVDQSEFTLPSEGGRVNLYANTNSNAATSMVENGATLPLPTADSLWDSLPTMMGYDMMLLSCEGTDNNGRSDAQYDNVHAYADQGGRIFGSHFHNTWINPDIHPYPAVVKFASGAHNLPDGFVAQVDTTFPKGVAFSDWLSNVGASTTPGQLVVNGSEHTIDSTLSDPTTGALLAQQWVYGQDTDKKTPTVQYFSFTTPVGAKECGRMVFSDLHVVTGSGDTTKQVFPSGCATSPLTAQEKALEFMLFDLSSCVQKDDKPPMPPPKDPK